MPDWRFDLNANAFFNNRCGLPIAQEHAHLSTIYSTVSRGTVTLIGSNFYRQTLNGKIGAGLLNLYPTARLDYQVSAKGTGSTCPDIPGQAGESNFTHYALSNLVDWTTTSALFNSVQFGIQSSVNGTNIGNSVYQSALRGDKIVNYGSGILPFIRNAVPEMAGDPAYTISNALSWIKGRHAFKFGGSAPAWWRGAPALRSSLYVRARIQSSQGECTAGAFVRPYWTR